MHCFDLPTARVIVRGVTVLLAAGTLGQLLIRKDMYTSSGIITMSCL